MTDYHDINYDLELDALFYDMYETEGVRKIKELSRQLRTFFNYKAQVIQFRFQSNLSSTKFSHENYTMQKFQVRKKEIESLSNEILSLLKSFKKEGVTLKERIQHLQFEINTTRFKILLGLTEKISTLIHLFSEDFIYHYPRFLKIIVKLAQIMSMVKSCLYQQFYKFYEELELNYSILDEELEVLLGRMPSVKKIKSLKQLEERLPS